MASYPPPNAQQGTIFNPIDWIEPNAGSIDTAYLNEHYCQFPVAQGSMSFAGINNTGSTTIKQNLVMTGTYNTNYLEFPDGTKQYSASASDDILNDDNTFTGVNNFNPTPYQTYGSILNQGITITNNQYSQLNLHEGDIIYSGTSTNGLCMFSTSSNNLNNQSPQIQLYPNGTQTVIQASNTNGIVELIANGTGGQIKLTSTGGVLLNTSAKIAFGTFGNLTGSSTGISSSANFTTSTLTTGNVNFNFSGVSNGAQLQPTNVGGLNILASTINLSTPTGGPTVNTILTAQANNLDISTPITLPTQTFSSIETYGNIASTQAFVRSAINSITTGDVFLGSDNNFTGENNFNNNINGGTTSNIGLTIVGNNQIGYAEADIICINQTTNLGLNIYAESTPITTTTVPKIKIFNDGNATVFNTDITLPTQTVYNSGTTYTNIASTQAFVQSALQSQGGGDALLNSPSLQTFTGPISFTSATIPQINSVNIATVPITTTLSITGYVGANSNSSITSGATQYSLSNTTTISFLSFAFTFSINTTPVQGASTCTVQFNIKPWSSYPPSNQTGNINMFCNNNSVMYNGIYLFSTSYSGPPYLLYLTPPAGAPNTGGIGITYTVNLASIGTFLA